MKTIAFYLSFDGLFYLLSNFRVSIVRAIKLTPQQRELLPIKIHILMKPLFFAVALLLATAATAQAQTTKMPVMRMADPDLYLELKNRYDPAPDPAPAVPPAVIEQTQGEERNPLAEYLLYQAALEACCPDTYREEMNQMFKDEKHLAAKQLDYLIWAGRLQQYLAGK